MTTAVPNPLREAAARPGAARARSGLLADRLEKGARALAELAGSLRDDEWQTALGKDRRTVGVVVHHVASVYPVEIQLAQTVAAGNAVTGVTMRDIDAMNAAHAADHAAVTRAEAIDLLLANSAVAAAAIRAMTDADLDRAANVSLYEDAPLTCQFVLEDHAVRHSYHHLALIRAAVQR
jgi:hypothetical protein